MNVKSKEEKEAPTEKDQPLEFDVFLFDIVDYERQTD